MVYYLYSLENTIISTILFQERRHKQLYSNYVLVVNTPWISMPALDRRYGIVRYGYEG